MTTAVCSASLAGVSLSDSERAQFGTTRLRRNGTPSARPWMDATQWPAVREHLLARSRKANPNLDEELTAYTPGETLALLEHPEIIAWHQACTAELDEHYRRLVFVPCAKTKPWTGPAVRRSKLYSAYNALAAELPDTCFVTISEPLGIVPMQAWADFPQYDNPGLFRCDAQRSGMTNSQWLQSPLGAVYATPFDEAARASCIELLGRVVAEFISRHRERELVAFVDPDTGKSTHGEMLDVAQALTGASVRRCAKRGVARVSPLPYLRAQLTA